MSALQQQKTVLIKCRCTVWRLWVQLMPQQCKHTLESGISDSP